MKKGETWTRNDLDRELQSLSHYFELRDIGRKEAVGLMITLAGMEIAHSNKPESSVKHCVEHLIKTVNHELKNIEETNE